MVKPCCLAKLTAIALLALSTTWLLLRVRWREQHSKTREQNLLKFTEKKPAAKLMRFFGEEKEARSKGPRLSRWQL
jgi:hypothetical protein